MDRGRGRGRRGRGRGASQRGKDRRTNAKRVDREDIWDGVRQINFPTRENWGQESQDDHNSSSPVIYCEEWGPEEHGEVDTKPSSDSQPTPKSTSKENSTNTNEEWRGEDEKSSSESRPTRTPKSTSRVTIEWGGVDAKSSTESQPTPMSTSSRSRVTIEWGGVDEKSSSESLPAPKSTPRVTVEEWGPEERGEVDTKPSSESQPTPKSTSKEDIDEWGAEDEKTSSESQPTPKSTSRVTVDEWGADDTKPSSESQPTPKSTSRVTVDEWGAEDDWTKATPKSTSGVTAINRSFLPGGAVPKDDWNTDATLYNTAKYTPARTSRGRGRRSGISNTRPLRGGLTNTSLSYHFNSPVSEMHAGMEHYIREAINELYKQKALSYEDHYTLTYEQQGDATEAELSNTHGLGIMYPRVALYKQLAAILEEWLWSGYCYAQDLQTYKHLDEGNGVERRKMVMDNVSCHMMTLRSSWEGLENDMKRHKIIQIFKDIGKRGMLDLIGVRRTVGSQDVFPPTRDVLEASFRELHNELTRSELTGGARALAKHCHRDGTKNWWGSLSGSEKAKNENGERVLKKILNNVGWLNIHQLPNALPILEVRNMEGYGARWSPDGGEFRGFLEPPMVAGWETGYRH